MNVKTYSIKDFFSDEDDPLDHTHRNYSRWKCWIVAHHTPRTTFVGAQNPRLSSSWTTWRMPSFFILDNSQESPKSWVRDPNRARKSDSKRLSDRRSPARRLSYNDWFQKGLPIVARGLFHSKYKKWSIGKKKRRPQKAFPNWKGWEITLRYQFGELNLPRNRFWTGMAVYSSMLTLLITANPKVCQCPN